MPINVDFLELRSIANEIGANEIDFVLNDEINPVDPIDVILDEQGIEADPSNLKLRGGPFEYEGRQVVLYIPNHSWDIEKSLSELKSRNKFHVTYCEYLEKRKKQNTIDRYIATNRLTGLFKIFGTSKQSRTLKEGEVELNVCMYCLKKLNYKGASSTSIRRQVRDSFDIAEFFSIYSSFFPFMPNGMAANPANSNYPKNWSKISTSYRQSKNYTCEHCHVDLNDHRNLLHTHHIDGIPGNNNYSNLLALCIDCHRKEHGHMYVRHTEMQTITKLRRDQGVIEQNWDSILRLADPALYGVLKKLQDQGYQPPTIGYSISSNDTIYTADVAWPNERFAIVVVKPESKISGWKLFTPEEYLSKDL
ncbi:hypothetical protein GZ77_04755 [Endozoicomonas montiporae]|uniref:HNH nuclease domain-containing protein n=2 Tax=Endozoicomonas montiporae TaxID=1027273 RepID=A0A081NBK8_9GAMM|nr:HNH endonuclease [Endozoicomonas montiporae]AMO56122.1 hypothetical protein EZMO1_2000 [Endozoicomonas montiporae CL-33]KEQ15831.1 hypothetical protein GZ77_04755 [Endozoicomonas montiporae]